MPRPVKTDRPVTAAPVLETQSSTIIVIQPGSAFLYIGRVTDHQPQVIPHVIARRVSGPHAEHLIHERESTLHRPGLNDSDQRWSKLKSGQQGVNHLLQSMRIRGGHRKPRFYAQEVNQFNSNVAPIQGERDSSVSWTDVSAQPELVIGEQAINIKPGEPYSCSWPIKFGKFNLHGGIGGSPSAVSADLTSLWGAAIEQNLDIPLEHLCFYRAVLLVPDMHEPSQVKMQMDVLLNRLKFSCVIVHQESVCACLGAGILSACVVDVGDQKTSISCVEDGISVNSSRLTMRIGGNDITRCFQSMLRKSSFPFTQLDTGNKLDVQLLQELKETFCHLSFNIPAGHVHEFQVIRPEQNSLTYQLKLGDEPMQAPSCLFMPDILGICGEKILETFPDQTAYDPEDLNDQKYVLEYHGDHFSKKPKPDAAGASSGAADQLAAGGVTPGEGGDSSEAASASAFYNLSAYVARNAPKLGNKLEYSGMPLDQAILHSIEQCGNTETKRKMYSTILLTGGGLGCFKGADEFLLQRLQGQLPQHYQFLKDQMEVMVRPKENDNRFVCWKGGSVLSILDSSQELWISGNEWNQYGVRILRERCAFQWSSNTDKV